ncbi:MAG: YrdB family protein [Thermoleophilia bacterium]
MRTLALALAFLSELAALAALAWAGAHSGAGTAISVLLAIALPFACAVAWGVFAAPRSRRRLSTGPRLVFELGVFAVSFGLLAVTGRPVWAACLAVVAVACTAYLGRAELAEGGASARG